MRSALLAVVTGVLLSAPAAAQQRGLPPALDAIREADLRRDLFALAGDAFRGREAGTTDDLRASMWLAEQARAAGMEPAGEDGTYFQVWPMRRIRMTAASRVAVDGVPLALWSDAVVVSPVDGVLDLPLVYVGEGREADVAGADLRGKAVVALLTPPANSPPVGPLLTARRYAMLAVRQKAAFLAQRGAAAVVLVSDSVAETQLQNIGAGWGRGQFAIDSAGGVARAPNATDRAPVVWVRAAALERLRRPGARLAATLVTESFVWPSVNVVARVRGADAAVRDEYVLFSGHQDGYGVRYPVNGDSVWNAADDNGTTSVALLAIGRAFVRRPARRSALFVWHDAEEEGLLGSTWHAAHPVVPRGQLVAVLNADMIGRNHPDTAGLLGSQPPHRNSAALVEMALEANARVSRFVIDSSWDRPSHPEGFFGRSDHAPYARLGVPVVYFTTMLHADYHTPDDEADRVDYAKLARVAKWMYATGWAAATAAERVRAEGDAGAGRRE